ncbi:MAG: type II toxin-antitoxin system death-on-curing family toxin [Anaeromicrobium sp.]|jgi:death-on-curing protein|uniref:type II toxin-antitoxin system death-on-curing family toxin n=1 Tax=Anaeromicrobium sp. TaxID=1929132 RepID=UPI0025D45D46|nr:type II toxin-antitoxin system death-on-curing family toxin [Anaeromicrobium sp.]MCT4592676.1 type II toxin-antitoxin system death-on-curing family toxin [Anaeromicrobium sp.]
MKNIGLDNILAFHTKIISKTGGSDGVRDRGLIESALNRAFVTFDGKDLYKEAEKKISIITHGLIRNHGFVDGNKRIGAAVMILLLRLNKIDINYTQEELVDFGLSVAEGKMNEEDIFNWINQHKI